MVVRAPDDDKAIAACVHDWFRNRGVDVRYRPGLAVALAAPPADPVDDIRALKWLQSQVIGTLRRLQERYPRADLIRFLFEGATMEDMANAREVVREIEAVYESRSEIAASTNNLRNASKN